MKGFMYYISKCLACAAWFVLVIISPVLLLVRLLYRIAVTPLAFIGIILVGYELFTGEVTTYNICCMLIFVAIIILRFFLVPISIGYRSMIRSLNNFIKTPRFYSSLKFI